ncbi:MAG: Pr6Pr family membrane protein [Candidatus Nanopelagicales bacterium]
MRDTWARIVYGITGFAAFIGVLFSSWITVSNSPQEIADEGSVPAAAVHASPEVFDLLVVRGLNTFVYFTIASNITVAVVCIILMTNPHKRGKVFDVFRVFSLVAIIITGIVYNAILRAEADPVGFSAFNTNIVHVFVPIMAVVGWLFFGPRIKFAWKTVWACAGIGLIWLVFTFIRGAFINWYPYPFLNVDYLGYPKAIGACVGILVIAILLACGILALDKKLPGEKPWLNKA